MSVGLAIKLGDDGFIAFSIFPLITEYLWVLLVNVAHALSMPENA
jgi:hypothetical protein